MFNGKLLLLWGESDYISSRDDHEIIADAVNHFHQGKATFRTIKNADHGMNTAATFAEARTNPGTYNREVGNVMLSWLKEQQLAKN